MATRLPKDQRPVGRTPAPTATPAAKRAPTATPAAKRAPTAAPQAQKASDAPLTASDSAPLVAPRPTAAAFAAATRKTAKMFTSWSYSRYRDWRACPLAAKLKHLDKIPEEPSAAMLRGIDVGTRLEKYLKREVATLPEECSPLEDRYVELRNLRPQVEQMWGLDRDWSPVPWNDWNACWLRVKMDVVYMDPKSRIVYPLDNKTGKYKERDVDVYLEQLDIYVAASASYFPTGKTFAPRLLYSDIGMEFPSLDDEGTPTLIYTRAEALSAQQRWNHNVKGLLSDTQFQPRPGRQCAYCSFRKEKGGPCAY